MDEDDVLSIWESFPDWVKGTTLLLILTYLTTLFSSFYWVGLPQELKTLFAYWPLMIVGWLTIVWLGFTLIIMFGVWVGGWFSKEPENDTITRKAKKVILYIPILVGSAISVSAVFMKDIFRPVIKS